ncbi:MAG: DUF4160 domain-containing protein [Elusimicrobia bacterium]|nr:DUF4160 domain-containing protein [Elusimicrobiota bacterium]
MSPTVFRLRGYRFYFFSREETRMHIHVSGADGEAKFWLEPSVELAQSHGFNGPEIARLRKIVETRQDEAVRAWHRHFGG